MHSTIDTDGIRHSELKVSYRTDQPDIAEVSHALDAVARQSGSQLIEHGSDRAERQGAARSNPGPQQTAQQLER